MKKTNKQLALLFVQHADGTSKDQMEILATHFIKWLHDRGELKRIPDIFRSIDIVWKEKYGCATITIETPYPIEATVRRILEKQVSGAEIREQVNPELIAGARLRIDERIIDGSLLGALNQLTNQLQNTA